MKTRLLIIIGILLSLVIIIIFTSSFTIFGSLLFPSEHCPDLGMKKLLGLVDPTAACL
ncbi:hypothetical protein [Nitrosopumilus sp. Nsub]|uniref:hypothetical protein n=1 Tax=Nitrosopumilus sp. Nsub TaxID=1776294 RepID=UPI000AB419D2|nr:hypothetical protein [Nitrosopumilus sp. Nsub]MBS1268847.1 hypothetical protein [Nitrosopumilus sp.]